MVDTRPKAVDFGIHAGEVKDSFPKPPAVDSISPLATAAWVQVEEVMNRIPGEVPLKPGMVSMIRRIGFDPAKSFEVKELPDDLRVVTVTSLSENRDSIQNALQHLGLSLSEDFATTESPVCMTFLVPEQNVAPMGEVLRASRSLAATVRVFEGRCPIAKIHGSGLLVLHGLDRGFRFMEESGFEEKPSIEAPAPEVYSKPVARSIAALEEESVVAQRPIQKSVEEFLRTYEDDDAQTQAISEALILPRKGTCRYLLIDQGFFVSRSIADPEVRQIFQELELMLKSPHFLVKSKNGYLALIGLSDQAGSAIALMADLLSKIAPKLQLIIGSGRVNRQNGKFSLTNFPSLDVRSRWSRLQEGIFVMPDLFKKHFANPESRDSRQVEMEAEPTMDKLLLKVTKITPRVKLHMGGPDRFSGYEEEMKCGSDFFKDSQGRLLILKGGAGMGKSRFLGNLLKEQPGSIVCSFASDWSAVGGFSLMSFASQILSKAQASTDIRNDPSIKHFQKIFGALPQARRLKFAQEHSAALADMTVSALRLIKNLNPAFSPLVLDDIHFVDSFSLQNITTILGRFMREAQGKVIFSQRPEDTGEPELMSNFRQETEDFFEKSGVPPNRSVIEITLKGLDFSRTLDMTERDIAYRFVFYCLPAELRHGKRLGMWYQALARASGSSPLRLANFLQILKDDPQNFVIDGEIIDLKPGVLERVLALSPETDENEIGKLYSHRIETLRAKNLDAVRLLMIFGLIGGSLSERQILTVAHDVFGIPEEEAQKLVELLAHGLFIGLDEAGGERRYCLAHATLREFVVADFSEQEKNRVSTALFECLQKEEEVSPSMMFGLACRLADFRPREREFDFADPFWAIFLQHAQAALTEAAQQKNYGLIESLGVAALETLPLRIALTAFESSKSASWLATVPEPWRQFALACLGLLAESALQIGQFEAVHARCERLVLIAQQLKRPKLIEKALLLRFEAAYVQLDTKAMLEIYEILKPSLEPSRALLCELKLAYRKHEYGTIQQLWSERVPVLVHEGMPHFLACRRIVEIMGPYDELINEVSSGAKDKLAPDGDYMWQPGVLNAALLSKVTKLQAAVAQFRATHMATKAEALDSYAELGLMEVEANLLAFAGRYEESFKLLFQIWNAAMQMNINALSARAAGMLGIVKIIMATTRLRTPSELSPEDRERFPAGRLEELPQPQEKVLAEAVQILSRQGMMPLLKGRLAESDSSHVSIRATRNMAIARLVEAVRARSKAGVWNEAQTKTFLEFYFHMATEAVASILANPRAPQWAARPDIQYYLNGSTGALRFHARELGSDFVPGGEDLRVSPFFNVGNLDAGKAFADKTDFLGLAENTRRRSSIKLLLEELVGAQQQPSPI